MDKGESQSSSVNREQNLQVAKRKASEEPNLPTATKRIKSSHDGSTEPNAELPAWRIPFPDKVC
jgi:hypothetical protein